MRAETPIQEIRRAYQLVEWIAYDLMPGRDLSDVDAEGEARLIVWAALEELEEARSTIAKLRAILLGHAGAGDGAGDKDSDRGAKNGGT